MKNRHGIRRGTYLSMSLGLIIVVTIQGTLSCASDTLKPLDQRASAPRFNPQAVFDLLGLKRIDYPSPGKQRSTDPSSHQPTVDTRLSSHSTVDDEGKRAQAALSIVSFQVAAGGLDDDPDSKTPLADRDVHPSIESVAPSIDSPERLTLAPPATDDRAQLNPDDALSTTESTEPLQDDGSFDLTVSSSVTAKQENRWMSESSESNGLDDPDVVDVAETDAAAETDVIAERQVAEDTPSFDGHEFTSEVVGEHQDNATEPWDDSRRFEPNNEPVVSEETSNETSPQEDRIDYRSTQTHSRRPTRQPDRAITPIESSGPMPGPPPVADKVVSYQAKLMIEDGIQLARRGAFYSARARFIRALRLITQSFDAQGGTRFYSESLARGLRALEEVHDFRPKGSRLEADLDLRRIVQSHRTPVLHSSDFHRLTTLVAQQAYHTYAENQLIHAIGRDPVAADALFALGKVQGHLTQQGGDSSTSGDAEAMSLYQAALTVDPDHDRAGNELGVLLARYGQLEDARAVLRHCVRDRTNSAEVWRNLARVHELLGEVELAKRANHEWQSARQDSGRSPGLAGKPSIQWVDPQTFANMSGPDRQSTHQEIATTRQRPERPATAVSRARKKPPLPSADGQPLSVGQRYGR